MSDIRCDIHVGEPWPARCADCEYERALATSPIPDSVPDFITPEEIEAQARDLAITWTQTRHPIEAVKAITDLADRTSVGRAVMAAHTGAHLYMEWVEFHVSTEEAVIRLRVLPAILMTIRRLSPTHISPPANITKATHANRSRSTSATPGGTE